MTAQAFEWRRPLAWVLAVLVMVGLAAQIVLAVTGSDFVDASDFYWLLLPAITALAAMLILLARPKNSIGWLLMIWAVGIGADGFVTILLSQVTEAPDRLSPGLFFLLVLQNWGWVLLIFPIFLLLQVFPTGRVLNRRWRWLMWLLFFMPALLLLGAIFSTELGPLQPSSVRSSTSVWSLPNPIGFFPPSGFESPLFGIPWTLGLLVLTLGGAASLIVRYRRAGVEDRQQIKWLAFAVVVFAVVYSGLAISAEAWELPLLVDVLFVLSIAAMPLAIAVAVLKYRLFDIDVVISRALVYALLGVFITVVYVGIVVGVGRLLGAGEAEPDTLLSVAATAVVAIGFQPVRRKLQELANRLVYGRRATPYQVLSDFSRRLAATDEGLIDQVARSLADGTSAQSAAVWVRSGEGFECRSVWPQETDSPGPVAASIEGFPGADRTAWVTHDGEKLGALTLTFPRGQQPTPHDERLLGELASGMGLALRNSVLTQHLRDRIEELRESRRRIVAVQDQTRRQLERDLHDGAQQQLVALKVKLALARRLAASGAAPRTAEVLEGLNLEADNAIQSMRDFARGIYPPLLESEGLASAVTAHARKSPIPVSVDTADIDRYPQPIETTVYFCIVEALQNTIKHARAASAHVTVTEVDHQLEFTVTDDGSGFDPTNQGHGLTNIADRLDANGGHLTIRSTPGHGTAIHGELPLPERVTT
jgi:signal transduction histidine kinase